MVRRFLDEMRERLKKFALTLHPEKTRLIEFGRFAAGPLKPIRVRKAPVLRRAGGSSTHARKPIENVGRGRSRSAYPPVPTAPVRIFAFSVDLDDAAPFVRREFDRCYEVGHARGTV
jgi:hypothetical protein